MTRWVALLRGVNVGGHAKLPIADFRALLGGMGFANVRSYIQSGNAVFDGEGPAARIASDIEQAVFDAFGFRRPVIVITTDELADAIAANPFAQTLQDPKQVHLMFLRGAVSFDAAGLETFADAGETASLGQGVLYLHTPNGFGTSKVAANLDRFLKAEVVTARNLRSVRAIADLAQV